LHCRFQRSPEHRGETTTAVAARLVGRVDVLQHRHSDDIHVAARQALRRRGSPPCGDQRLGQSEEVISPSSASTSVAKWPSSWSMIMAPGPVHDEDGGRVERHGETDPSATTASSFARESQGSAGCRLLRRRTRVVRPMAASGPCPAAPAGSADPPGRRPAARGAVLPPDLDSLSSCRLLPPPHSTRASSRARASAQARRRRS